MTIKQKNAATKCTKTANEAQYTRKVFEEMQTKAMNWNELAEPFSLFFRFFSFCLFAWLVCSLSVIEEQQQQK